MKNVSVFVGLCALLAGMAEGRQPPSAPAAPRPLVDEADRYKVALAKMVREYESEVAKCLRLQALGAISTAEVNRYRVLLAFARLNLARFEKKLDGARDQINVIIEIHDSELRRLQALHRVAGTLEYEVRDAERRLANARYQLALLDGESEDAVREMRVIAKCREGELKDITDLRGARSETQVEGARYNLAWARYRLARLEGKSDDAVREARTGVEIAERLLKRATAMVNSGTASKLVNESVRALVHDARLRLAIVENKQPQARDHLRQLIESLEEIQRLRSGPDSMPMRDTERAGLVAVLPHDIEVYRGRLAAASKGVAIADYDPWGAFDN